MKKLEELLDKMDLNLKSNEVLREEIKQLFSSWYAFANKYVVDEEYIYEWLNDMDARRLLHHAFAKLNQAEKTEMERLIMPLDIKVKENTFEVNECIWGAANEIEHKYNRVVNWYYYRVNQKIFEQENGFFTKG